MSTRKAYLPVSTADDVRIHSNRLSASSAPAPRLRVLTFSTVFPSPGRELHGSFVLERARHLARCAELKVVAPVAAWRPRTFVRESFGISVSHPAFWYLPGVLKCLDGYFLFLSARRCIARLRTVFDFDVIDAHFCYPDGFAAVLLGRLYQRPVTITERGTLPLFPPGSLRRRLAEWALRHADRVITVSEPLASLARHAGVAPDRVVVIENGVDAQRFAPLNRIEARRRLAIDPSVRLLVSVGHISPRKGFHRVIAAMPYLLPTFPDLQLAIVGGPGAERSNLRALRCQVHRLRLQQKVKFAGPQDPSAVSLWLSAADLFVLASEQEGCPNVVWEAMACGLPVVATKVGHVDRMVPPHAGILYSPQDGAKLLYESLARALTQTWDADCIRRHATRHDWQSVARRVLVEWRAAVGGNRISCRCAE